MGAMAFHQGHALKTILLTTAAFFATLASAYADYVLPPEQDRIVLLMDLEAARLSVFKHVDIFYNSVRLH